MSDLNQFMDDRGPSQQESTESTLNLRHYWHIVLERRWLVVATFLGVFALSIIYLVQAVPIYTSQSRLQIDQEETSVVDSNVDSGSYRNHNEYLQTMYKNLLSRSLIEKVRLELNLDEDERYKRALDKTAAVRGDITISPIRLTYLVDINVDHPNNERAAEIANSLATNFRTEHLARIKKKLQDGIETLKDEILALENTAKQDAQALLDYSKRVGGASLDKAMELAKAAYAQANADYQQALAEASVASGIAQEAEKFLHEGKVLSSIPVIAKDSAILQLKQELAKQQSILAGLLTKYKSKYPAVISAREEIQSTENSIVNRSKEVYQGLQADATFAAKKATSLRDTLTEAENKQLDLDQKILEYQQLADTAQQSKEILNTVRAEAKKHEINQAYKSNNVSIIDRAIPANSPSKPKKSLILLMGVVGGLAAGLGLAFFINFLDDSVKTQEDIENVLRLQFLGYIPNIKTNSLVERDLQAHLHPQSTAAEAFRTLRTAVSLMPKADDLRVISMTSTIPSEGKSLVASNLAIVMAQTGMKTVLVDADLRRPSVHKAFQLHSPVGLAAYLKREVNSLDEIVHKSEVPDLDIICCGGIPGSPSELVGSTRMSEFIEELKNRYDRVIIDCPPVSAVSDPLVISARTDGVVFVNKFNRIRREHARRTIQRIQDAGVRILGAVINDIDFEGKDSYYYSYYYYQNRYYASHYSGDSNESSQSKKKAS